MMTSHINEKRYADKTKKIIGQKKLSASCVKYRERPQFTLLSAESEV